MSETARELEKIFAQELDMNELRVVAGGDLEENHPEDGPDTNCYFDHWCVMTFLHTETDRTDVECFKNYDCIFFSN